MTSLTVSLNSIVILLILLAGPLMANCRSTLPDQPQPLQTVSLLPAAAGPGPSAANPQTGLVYVVNDSGHVSVFRGTELVKTFPVGKQVRPTLAVDSQQGWVYVVNEGSSSVSVIRETAVITTVEVAGMWPTGVAIEPKSHWAYVVSGRSKTGRTYGSPLVEGNVTVLKGDERVGVIPLGRTLARSVVIDPVHSYVYVGAVGGDVAVIQGLEEVARYNVAFSVVSMDVDPRTGEVYVLAPAPDNRDLNRFRQGRLIESIKVEGQGGTVDTLQVHPVTGDVYVIDFIRREVVVVRAVEALGDALAVIGRVPVGAGPSKLAIDPVTENVYVANIYDNTVTAIRGTEVLTTYQVGWYPFGIGVNPANGWVYVSNTNEHSVTVLGFE